MFCKNCGAQNDDNVQFCTACGTALTDAAQAPVYQEPAAPVYVPVAAQPAKVPGKGLAIASLVLGLVGLIISALICGLLAVIFAGVAKSKGNKSGMATAGLVLGIIDLAFWLVTFIFCNPLAFL